MAASELAYTGWMDLTADLLRRRPSGLPEESVGLRLGQTFECASGQAWVEPDGSLRLEFWRAPAGWRPSDLRAAWRGRADDHPVVARFLTSGDSTATTLRRTSPEAAAESTSRVGPKGLEHQLWIPWRVSDSDYRAFVLARSDADFTDDQVGLARRLQPLIMLVSRQLDGVRHARPAGGALTDRELAVLRLLGEGETAGGIGHRLGISPRTAHKHLEHVYRKLGVSDRLLAVQRAREAGLLGDPLPVAGGSTPAP